MRAVVSFVIVFVGIGCANPAVQNLRRTQVSPLTVAEAQAGRGVGERVRWGGTIAQVHVREQETCLEVVARRLDGSARPLVDDQSEGRFWACRSDFLDPDIYSRGRSVTVVGPVRELAEGRVGERAYRFPVVQVEQLQLWPEPGRTTARCPCPEPYLVHPWLWGPPYWWPYWYGRGRNH